MKEKRERKRRGEKRGRGGGKQHYKWVSAKYRGDKTQTRNWQFPSLGSLRWRDKRKKEINPTSIRFPVRELHSDNLRVVITDFQAL